MFNCWPWGGAGVAQTWLSIVVYGIPGNNVCVKKTTSQSEAYHIWEGGEQSCTFPTGVTFKWNIPANAQLRPNYSFVSTGTNGYKVFDGFKDDHGAAPGYNYHSCEKIYYYI
ncbi:hypothetical protein N0V88_006837 [Collariella sp. IMI 366227]|nr:hypothetical protein N0V88_006837 [Collariella sp. IMI 366227]